METKINNDIIGTIYIYSPYDNKWKLVLTDLYTHLPFDIIDKKYQIINIIDIDFENKELIDNYYINFHISNITGESKSKKNQKYYYPVF